MISSVSPTDVNAAQEYEFTFRHGGTVLTRFSGSSTEFLIGADPACDILLEIEGVAPRQARLRLNGGVFLTNLDEKRGTYVNGLEISGEWELQPWHSITFGDAEGELRLEAPSAEAIAKAARAAEEAAAKAAEEAAAKAAEEAAAKAAEEAAAKAAKKLAAKEIGKAVRTPKAATGKAARRAAAKASKKATIKPILEAASDATDETVVKAVQEVAKKEVEELTKELKKRELDLVEAWSRRQAAEEHCLELSQQLNQMGGAAPRPAAHRVIHRKLLWAGLIAIAVGAVVGAIMVAGNFRAAQQRAQQAEAVVHLLKSVAPQLHREAESALVDGQMESALAKIEKALALEPDKAAYHLTLGNIHESLLRIPQAEAAYTRAVALAPSLAEAQENLELCRRISATRDGVRKMENLQGLHRVMLKQKRLTEALRIARLIVGDRLILHRTWEAILQAAGIRGDLRLNTDGTFDLDLMAGANADLSALRDLPLRSLKAARADITDLTPLRGMPLRHLDISETMVRDISVLRGMSLETLDLSSTAVTNLAPLRMMPLQTLRLDFTNVADVSDLRGLPLRSLSVQGTLVQSIAGLAQMPLRQLNVAHTGIKDLSALKNAPLEVLNLEGTAVTDLTPLTGAPLTSLTISGTRVVSLEPLRGLPLRELRLVGCQSIGSLAPLGACLDLERLVLPRRGMDLTPLQGLGRLRFLSYEPQTGEGKTAPSLPTVPLEGGVRQTVR